jgi:Tol biopolymer transport system component
MWYQPFPRGEPQRVTNDASGYAGLSLTADGKLLATVQSDWSSTIFVAPAANPDSGTPLSAVRSDGIGLEWMPDGRLLSQDLRSQFWTQTPDGKSRSPLFQVDAFPGDFSVCGDGRFVVFVKRTQGTAFAIWRVDAMGRSFQQLTNDDSDDATPDCSPDGAWTLYISSTKDGYLLKKIPTGGGPSTNFIEPPGMFYGGYYSPQGNRIAVWPADVEKVTLAVLNSQTLQSTMSFPIPATGQLPDNQWRVHWKPDGSAVTYFLQQGATVNVWSQPVSGGPPQQITHFPDRVIAFAWSRDGKYLAYTRATTSRDVVLLNFH